MKLKFKITTPEKTVYEDEIDQLTVMTAAGEITVLPNHIPLVSLLYPGEMRIKKGGEMIPMAVTGGFLEVRPGSELVILADAAERVEEIDEVLVEQAKEKAVAALREKFTAADFEDAALALEREVARLRVIRKYRHKIKHGATPETSASE